VTLTSSLGATGIIVYLVATNPRITPTDNRWTTAVFTDDPNQYVRWSEQLSYEIKGMKVSYKGNNQLGESASGFFTFEPVSNAPTKKVSFVVTPPPMSGFRVFCTEISPLGFLRMPQCQSGGVNEPLMLTFQFDNLTINSSQSYTFGIQVYNPGGRPLEENNYWGLSLKDAGGETWDAHLDIPGLDLGTVPMRIYDLGWTSADYKVIAKIMIQLRVLHEIQAGSMTEIWIQAPKGIMFVEDMAAFKVIPLPLPLRVGTPTAIAGDVLIMYIDQQRPITPALYNVRFEVVNPTNYPHDNTWSFLVKRNIDVEFSHVLTGYYPGKASPLDVSMAQSQATTSSATRLRGHSSLWLWALFSVLASPLAHLIVKE